MNGSGVEGLPYDRPSVTLAIATPPPQFDADMPARPARLALLVRPFRFVPHVIILAALNEAVALTTLLSWFAIVATGRLPRSLFAFGAFCLRWYARVAAYMALLTDQPPPLGDSSYPAQLVIHYPACSSRLRTFFRLLLAIPSMLAVWLLSYVALASVIIAWFFILFGRRYPLGLYLFVVGYLRWWLRLQAYLWLLTDHYPPFQLSEIPNPAAAFLAQPAPL